jgi:hypothetical protein
LLNPDELGVEGFAGFELLFVPLLFAALAAFFAACLALAADDKELAML